MVGGATRDNTSRVYDMMEAINDLRHDETMG
jgi:hypothetical protein